MERVKDKVVVITGAGSGLGKADALRLSEEGAKLVLTDINEVEGRRSGEECEGEAIFFAQDVKDESLLAPIDRNDYRGVRTVGCSR